MMNRYEKQVLFLGEEHQQTLQQARVLIVGAGALGSASAEMLARAGVGCITIVDRDYVEWSNLQRQNLYCERDVQDKLPKAIAAQNRLKQINSGITIYSYIADVNACNVEQFVEGQSIIMDATDNFETRLVVNDAAVKHGIPFVFGACVASYGLTFTIIPGQTPCLHCLLQHLPFDGLTCDVVGVISPVVQMVAAYQVSQAMQLLVGQTPAPILQSFDLWKHERAEIQLASLRFANCLTCGPQPSYPYLQQKQTLHSAVLCGRNAIQIRPTIPAMFVLDDIAQQLQTVATNIKTNRYLLSCTITNHRIVLFQDGRAIIHDTKDIDEATAIYKRMMQREML